MKLGEIAIEAATGAVLVHTTRAGELVLKKGRVLSPEDVAALARAGATSVLAARLEPEDVEEDAAAAALARAIAGEGTRREPAKTGRCNVYAAHAGLLLVDAAAIARVNAVDESLTVATIAADSPVRAGDMVSTVKVIPFSVERQLLTSAIAASVRNADLSTHVRGPDSDPFEDHPSDEGRHLHVRYSDASTTVRIPDSEPSVRNPDGADPVRIPDNTPHRPRSEFSSDWANDPTAQPVAAVRVRPWIAKRAGLVLTRFADTHPSLLEKSEAAQRERVRRCGGELAEVRVVAHRRDDVAAALRELAALGLDPILAMGASAIMDRRDVIPSAVEQEGGELIRFGMPVDPGNLLLLARLPAPAVAAAGERAAIAAAGEREASAPAGFARSPTTNAEAATPAPASATPSPTAARAAAASATPSPTAKPAPATPAPATVTVIGVPSCARSLKRSGFDWVLERTCAGVPMTSADLAALGVGGLLEEIELRPAPRRSSPEEPAARQIAAVILAAGRSSRMGSPKLLELLEGKPLVRWAAEAALASAARPVVVVTGHRAEEVSAALADLPVQLVHNPDYAQGMATSLRAGVSRVEHADAAVICLGDMPRVTAAHLDRILAAFDPASAPIVVPTHERKRGNPVLWARRFFPEIEDLRGDVGARALLERHADAVHLLAIDEPGVLLDVDTPEALQRLREAERPTPEPPG